MLLALDPNATWDFVLPGQEGVADPVTLTCRYISVRGMMEFRNKRAAVLQAQTDEEWTARLLGALGALVVEVRGLPSGAKDVAGLLDVATQQQLWDWCGDVARGQSASEIARKNSESRQLGFQATSAVSAEAGTA